MFRWTLTSWLLFTVSALPASAEMTRLEKEQIYQELEKDIQAKKEIPWCDSFKEYVTTLEYMRKQEHYQLGEQNSREIAEKVSAGCNGAAQRYVRIYELLRKVEAGARTSIKKAVELSAKSDSHVTTFMNVFKNAYAQDQLDLDINSAIQIATSLSIDYEGDPLKAKADYDKLVKFCLDQKNVGGSIPVCATIALKIAKAGERFQASSAEAFISIYNFLRSKKDLDLQISKAIEIAEQVSGIHPRAVQNYMDSFDYAMSKKGLAVTTEKTLLFAQDIANKTIPNNEKTLELERLPASQNE